MTAMLIFSDLTVLCYCFVGSYRSSVLVTSIVVKVVVTIYFMFVMNRDRSSRSYRETLDVQGNLS